LNYGLVNEIELSENKEALIVLAATIMPFISTLAVRNVSSTNVQVVRVSFSANDLANQNVRNFSLELQEVS